MNVVVKLIVEVVLETTTLTKQTNENVNTVLLMVVMTLGVARNKENDLSSLLLLLQVVVMMVV